MKKVKKVKRKRYIPTRIRNGLFYLSLYGCLVILSLLSFSFSFKEALDTVIKDKRLILILLLLTIIFVYLIYDSLTRVYRKYHYRKFIRFINGLLKYTCSTLIFGVTALCIVFYVPYLHISNNFEKTVAANHFKAFKPGLDLLKRKGNWTGTKAVAHAFGDMNGSSYIECFETFYQSYDEGYRAFEIDLIPTSDDYLVCRHLWADSKIQSGIDQNHVPTLDEFKSIPFYGQYTPISFMDLCQLMKQYPDIWILVDTKIMDIDTNVHYFSKMLQEATTVGCESVMDRFIVNLYSQELYQPIIDIYPFKDIIFTTYIDWDGNTDTFTNNCRWCALNNVDSISMWEYLYNERVQSIADYYGIDVYVHTVDNIDYGRYYLNLGAKGIYTNIITPGQLEEGE